MQRLAQVAKQARYAAMLLPETATRRAPGLAVFAMPPEPGQIVLRHVAQLHYKWHFLPSSNYAFQMAHGTDFTGPPTRRHFQRAHGWTRPAPWFGSERLLDQSGRIWEREFAAVVDDFGNLVEVPPQ